MSPVTVCSAVWGSGFPLLVTFMRKVVILSMEEFLISTWYPLALLPDANTHWIDMFPLPPCSSASCTSQVAECLSVWQRETLFRCSKSVSKLSAHGQLWGMYARTPTSLSQSQEAGFVTTWISSWYMWLNKDQLGFVKACYVGLQNTDAWVKFEAQYM